MTAHTPQNDVTELRAILFDTLRALKDPTNPMEIERARAVADVAQTMINSAKVEVEHMKLSGGKGSGFMPELPAGHSPSLPSDTTIIDQKPGVTVSRHRLRG